MTHEVFFFPDGVTAVMDVNTREQVPELQESWLRLFVNFLQAKGIDPTECILTMPNGRKAVIFRLNDVNEYNWRIE